MKKQINLSIFSLVIFLASCGNNNVNQPSQTAKLTWEQTPQYKTDSIITDLHKRAMIAIGDKLKAEYPALVAEGNSTQLKKDAAILKFEVQECQAALNHMEQDSIAYSLTK